MSNWKTIWQTILISLLFFFVLWLISSDRFFGQRLGFELEPLHFGIALIPFIILLILSGKLKEIRGPGGWVLSLRDEVQKTMSPDIVEKEPLQVDPAIVQQKGPPISEVLAQKRPSVLGFTIGKKHFYWHDAIIQYIEALAVLPGFRFILFTDEPGKFVGGMKVADFIAILAMGDIVPKLENGDILNDPRVIKNTIQVNATNKQALNEMEKASVNILSVVDQEGEFIGVVTQEELVRKILSKVLQEA